MSESKPPSADDTAETPDAEGPGKVIREAREARSLSIRQLADELHLPTRTLTALEGEDWERLSNPTFVRGYIRSISRVLELDAEVVLALYDNADSPDLPEVRAPIRPGAEREATRVVWGALAMLVLVLVLVGMALLLGGDDDAPSPAPTPAVAAVPAPAPAAAGPSPPPVSASGPDGRPTAAGAKANTSTAPVVAAPPPPSSTAGTPAVADSTGTTTSSAPSDGSAAPPKPASARVGTVTGTGPDQLMVEFREDCWMEITDSSGQRLFSELARADTAASIRGTAPFRVILGYAQGASMSFNGQPVALGPHTRAGVAELVVGQR